MSSTRSKANGNGTPSAAATQKGKEKPLPLSSKDVLHQSLPTSALQSFPSGAESFKATSARPQAPAATGKETAASALKGANPQFERIDNDKDENDDETVPSFAAPFKKEAPVKSAMAPPAPKTKPPVSSAKATKKVEKGKTPSTSHVAAQPALLKHQAAPAAKAVQVPTQEIAPMMISESAHESAHEMMPDELVPGEPEQFAMENDLVAAMENDLIAAPQGHKADNHEEIQDAMFPAENEEQNNIDMINDDDAGAAAAVEENEEGAASVADEAMEEEAPSQPANDMDKADITDDGEGAIILPPAASAAAAIQMLQPQPNSIEKELEELQAFAVNAMKESNNQSQLSRLHENQRGESKALVASAYVALAIGLDSQLDALEYLQMKALSLADACLAEEGTQTQSAMEN